MPTKTVIANKRRTLKIRAMAFRVAIVTFSVALAPIFFAGVQAQEVAESVPRPGASLTAFPYLGAVWTDREARLPAAASAGMRVTLEFWNNTSSNVGIATFIGGSATLISINEARVCESGCPGETDVTIEYIVAGEVGFGLDENPGPYVLVFVGRAYPSVTGDFDPFTGRYTRNSSITWGAGGGISPKFGKLQLRAEFRFRRDQRFEVGMRDTYEARFGVPLGSR